MYAIFSVVVIGLALVVPELRMSACGPYGVFLGAIAATAFLTGVGGSGSGGPKR